MDGFKGKMPKGQGAAAGGFGAAKFGAPGGASVASDVTRTRYVSSIRESVSI